MTTAQIIISIQIDAPAWRDVPLELDLETLVEATARNAFLSGDHAWLPPSEMIDISFLLTDDKTIQGINAEYRGKNKPTNVLSFPQHVKGEDTPMESGENEKIDYMPLGDIILALETIQREAEEQNKDFDSHLSHMIVHGILHLLGYDHENDQDAEIMERLEADILLTLGIENPYETDQHEQDELMRENQ